MENSDLKGASSHGDTLGASENLRHHPLATAPVVFLVFNRPDCTAAVFEMIRRAEPAKLLVVADGPRAERPGEMELCEEVRRIVNEGIDWSCEVLTNYSPVNLGCRDRVVSGLDWVFSNVDNAIILEDDCLPDPTFFQYASELLIRYKDDTRVFAVSGNNFQKAKANSTASYYFSQYPHIWGWATWRRVWKLYDVGLSDWPESGSIIKRNLNSKKAFNTFKNLFDRCKLKRIDTWDYQLCHACFRHQGLTVIPDRNLVKNIGFDARATHTTKASDRHAALPPHSMDFPMSHPNEVCVNNAADENTVDNHFSESAGRIAGVIKSFIKRLIPARKPAEPII